MKYLLILLMGIPSFIRAQTITFLYDAAGNRISKQILGNIPMPKIIGDSTACNGSIVDLVASGGNTYSWNIGGTQPTIAVLIDSTATYTVTAYGITGCPVTKSHTVKIIPLPVTDSIVGITVAEENNIDTFSVSYHPNSYYNWMVNSGSIINGIGTNQVAVRWNRLPGEDVISVYETDTVTGCDGIAAYKPIRVVPLSVKEKQHGDQFSLYPNPTSDGCTIEFSSTELGPFMLTVVDIKGQLIYREALPNQHKNKKQLEANLFPASGVYLIKIQSQNSISVQKLTVTKI